MKRNKEKSGWFQLLAMDSLMMQSLIERNITIYPLSVHPPIFNTYLQNNIT